MVRTKVFFAYSQPSKKVKSFQSRQQNAKFSILSYIFQLFFDIATLKAFFVRWRPPNWFLDPSPPFFPPSCDALVFGAKSAKGIQRILLLSPIPKAGKKKKRIPYPFKSPFPFPPYVNRKKIFLLLFEERSWLFIRKDFCFSSVLVWVWQKKKSKGKTSVGLSLLASEEEEEEEKCGKGCVVCIFNEGRGGVSSYTHTWG